MVCCPAGAVHHARLVRVVIAIEWEFGALDGQCFKFIELLVPFCNGLPTGNQCLSFLVVITCSKSRTSSSHHNMWRG